MVQCPTPASETGSPNIGIANVSSYLNISNLNSANWVFGNTTQTQYFLNLFQYMTSNNVTNCPLATPYVLSNTTNCSVCPAETPIFDISQRKCIVCPNKYVYDAATHQCVLNSTCPTGFKFNTTTLAC